MTPQDEQQSSEPSKLVALCLCEHIVHDHTDDGCQALVNNKPCGCPHFLDSGTSLGVTATTFRRSQEMPGYTSRLAEWLS